MDSETSTATAAKPFSVTDYELADTATLTLKNKAGTDDLLGNDGQPVTVEVYSTGSDQGVKAQRKQSKRAQMRLTRTLRGELDNEGRRERRTRAGREACRLHRLDQRQFPVGAVAVYSNPKLGYISRQVAEFIAKDAKFLAPSSGQLSLHVRQLAWLHAVPKAAGSKSIAKKPGEQMTRLKSGVPGHLPEAGLDYMVVMLVEAGPTMTTGMGAGAAVARRDRRLPAQHGRTAHAVGSEDAAAAVDRLARGNGTRQGSRRAGALHAHQQRDARPGETQARRSARIGRPDMLAGQLEIDLVAGVAQLTKDIGVAKTQVVGAMREINDAVATTKKALELFGVTLSVGFAVEFVKSSIEATSRMKELAVQTGTTAESLSRFEVPARTAGSSMDAVAQAITHMSKAATDSQDPASRSAKALDAIGLSAAQLKNLKPDEMFELVARRLGEYSDSIGKNAVQQQLLGRGGAEVNRVLAAIAESGKLASTVTNEQAEQANKLTGEVTKLNIQGEELTRGFLSDWVPGLTRIVQAIKQAREESGLLAAAWAALGGAAAEIVGLNDSDAQRFKKGLQAAQEQVVEFKAHIDVSRQHDLLAGLVQPINMIEASFMRANAQARLLQETINAYAGKYDDQASRAARQGQVLSPGQKPLNFNPSSGQTDSAYARMLADATREFTTAQAQQALGADRLTSAEKKLLELEADPKWKDLSTTEQKNIKTKLDAAAVIEKQAQAAKDYAEALTLANAEQEQFDREWDAIMDKGKDRLMALQDQIDAYTAENAIIGSGNLARELLNLDLQKERDLRGVVNENTRDGITAKYDELKALAGQRDMIQQQVTLWNQVGDAAGNFFSDLVMHGKSAFDNLRQYVKQLLADMISLFAKRWILSLAAGGGFAGAGQALTGSTGNSLGGSLLTSVGGNLLAGGISGGSGVLGGVGSSILTSGVSTTLFGSAGLTDTLAFTGTGLSGAAGSAAIAAGASAETAAAIASWVPVIGWVVAVAAVLYAAFGSKGGGPKVGGSAFGTFDASGAFQGNAPVPGTDNGRFFTPDQLDPQMTSYRDAVASSYYKTVARYGGHALSLDIGGGADNDPSGTAQSRVSGMVVNHATGEVLFRNQDQNMDDKAVPAALTLQAQQMVVAALQHSDLPQYLANVFKGVNALTLTQDQINALFQTADALKGIMDVVTRDDPLADAAQAWSDALDPFDAALRNNGLAVRSVMNAYDGSTASAQGLQQATVATTTRRCSC
jgi:hypothetical protein